MRVRIRYNAQWYENKVRRKALVLIKKQAAATRYKIYIAAFAEVLSSRQKSRPVFNFVQRLVE